MRQAASRRTGGKTPGCVPTERAPGAMQAQACDKEIHMRATRYGARSSETWRHGKFLGKWGCPPRKVAAGRE